MTLTCISESGGDLPLEQGRLIAALSIGAVEHLGGDALLMDADNRPHKWRMARIDDIVVVDQPADDTGPRCINCYFVEGEKTFRLDRARLLFSLRRQHKARPPDFLLVSARDPQIWLDFVVVVLLAELN